MIAFIDFLTRFGLTAIAALAAIKATGLKGRMQGGARVWTEDEARRIVAAARGLQGGRDVLLRSNPFGG